MAPGTPAPGGQGGMRAWDAGLRARADAGMMRSLLQNLLGNA